MEISGKVIQILPVRGGTSARTGNPWQVLTFVIETQETFPRKVAIEIFGEQRIKDNPVAVDDIITANVDIESREFNGSWFTSVRARNVIKGAAQPVAATEAPAQAAPQSNVEVFDNTPEDNGELPF